MCSFSQQIIFLEIILTKLSKKSHLNRNVSFELFRSRDGDKDLIRRSRLLKSHKVSATVGSNSSKSTCVRVKSGSRKWNIACLSSVDVWKNPVRINHKLPRLQELLSFVSWTHRNFRPSCKYSQSWYSSSRPKALSSNEFEYVWTAQSKAEKNLVTKSESACIIDFKPLDVSWIQLVESFDIRWLYMWPSNLLFQWP